MQSKSRRAAAGHAFLLTGLLSVQGACHFDFSDQAGSICIYTAVDRDQLDVVIPEFLTRYPDIALRCPGADAENVYCPGTGSEDPSNCDQAPWEVVQKPTGLLTTLLQKERQKPVADVIWGLAISSLLSLNDDLQDIRLLEPYAPAGLPALESAIEKQGTEWENFLDPGYPALNEYPLWTGLDAFMVSYCVNTNAMLPDGVSLATLDWSTLLDASFQGKLAMPRADTAGAGFAMVAGILSIYGEDEGWKYLEELDANVLEYTENGALPCALAAQGGEVQIGITFDAAVVLGRDVAGAPVDLAFPSRTGYDIAANALVKKENPKLVAMTFLDWASLDAMNIYSLSTPIVAIPTGDKYPTGYPEDPTELWADLNFQYLAGTRDDIISKWKTRFCPDALPEGSCFPSH